MGENQGLVWIIIGVLVIAAAVIMLGTSMSGTLTETDSAMNSTADSALSSLTATPAP